MLLCAIIDDQRDCIDLLNKYIANVPELDLVFSSTNSVEGLNYITEQSVDIVFLDIEMPDLNGLEFLQGLRERFGEQMPLVVFTTGYAQYALDGFDYDILDFLKKPIFLPRFLKTIQRAKRNLLKQSSQEYIFIEQHREKKKLWLDQIILVKANGNYIQVITTHSRYELYMSLQEMKDKLPSKYFVRIHKSYVVAVEKIQRYSSKSVTLEGYPDEVSVGALYRPTLENSMNRLKA